MYKEQRTNQHVNGFTLFEVMLSLSILVILSVSVTQMLRNSIDLRLGLANKHRINHRLSFAINKIVKDIEHVYIISDKDLIKNNSNRRGKTIFKFTPGMSTPELAFTSLSHEPKMADSHESDETYIVYSLKENKSASGYYDLYRNETKRIPEDFNIELKSEIIAKYIKKFDVKFWNGESWISDKWDSSSGETHDILPWMVQITLEGWDIGIEDEDDLKSVSDDLPTDKISTVVFLEQAIGMKELKEGAKSINWDRL